MESPDRERRQAEIRRTRVGGNWFWRIVGVLGLGRPIVNREDVYGDDPRNDPYDSEFDPERRRNR
jgi:hypothetical protein